MSRLFVVLRDTFGFFAWFWERIGSRYRLYRIALLVFVYDDLEYHVG